jgi:hypothetical protein
MRENTDILFFVDKGFSHPAALLISVRTRADPPEETVEKNTEDHTSFLGDDPNPYVL